MSDGSEMQPGEIQRALTRIEADLKDFRTEARDRSHSLANQMNVQFGHVAGHTIEIEALKEKAVALEAKVDAVTAAANKVAGVSAVLAVIGSWLVSWLRHP